METRYRLCTTLFGWFFVVTIHSTLEQSTKVRGCLLRRTKEFLNFGFFLMAVQLLDRECDLTIDCVNVQNGSFKLITNIGNVLRTFDFLLTQLGDVNQAFDTLFNFQEDTKVSYRSGLATDDSARSVR